MSVQVMAFSFSTACAGCSSRGCCFGSACSRYPVVCRYTGVIDLDVGWPVLAWMHSLFVQPHRISMTGEPHYGIHGIGLMDLTGV